MPATSVRLLTSWSHRQRWSIVQQPQWQIDCRAPCALVNARETNNRLTSHLPWTPPAFRLRLVCVESTDNKLKDVDVGHLFFFKNTTTTTSPLWSSISVIEHVVIVPSALFLFLFLFFEQACKTRLLWHKALHDILMQSSSHFCLDWWCCNYYYYHLGFIISKT